jgi:hypothetical protein
MPINEVILQLIDSLGALGSMVGGVHAAQQMTQARRSQIATEVVSAVGLGVIDEALLGNMSNRVKQAVKRLTDAYGNPANNDQALDEEKKIAKHKVCKYLQDIRSFNKGTLPQIPMLSDYLNEQWESFGCTGT